MSPAELLFLFRLLAAALLLLFFAGIAWFIYQELSATLAVLALRDRIHGQLVVAATAEGNLPLHSSYPLLPITRLGRNVNNHIVLTDSFASGEHAMLVRKGNQWWLEDSGSRNGTVLNELPLTGATVLADGDLIGIGALSFRVELSQDKGEKEWI